jgi:3-dehydroquinate synthase
LQHTTAAAEGFSGAAIQPVQHRDCSLLRARRCKEVLSLGGQQQVDEVVLPDGEEFKSMDVIAKIWDRALQLRLDRKSVRT